MKTHIEELAKRIAGKTGNGEFPVDQTVRIAVMKKGGACEFGGTPLDADDYVINEELKGKLKAGDEVLVMQLSEERHVVLMKVVEP